AKYHCNRLIWYEGYDDVRKAIDREKQLKGWTRAKKIALIESKNPRWEDLAEKWGAEMLFANQSIKNELSPKNKSSENKLSSLRLRSGQALSEVGVRKANVNAVEG